MRSPEDVGGSLRQLKPERPLHGLFSLQVSTAGRRGDDPCVVGPGFLGRLGAVPPSDARDGLELLHGCVDILASQVGLKARADLQHLVSVQQLNFPDARIKERPIRRVDAQCGTARTTA